MLDETDEFLESGFEQLVHLITSQIRPDRQACLFSATWPNHIEQLAKDFCSFRPIHINAGSIKLASCKHIEQHFKIMAIARMCVMGHFQAGRGVHSSQARSALDLAWGQDFGFILLQCMATEVVLDYHTLYELTWSQATF